MRFVGLLGGIASGKSTVADALRRRGAVVLDGDQTGHEVLRDPEVLAAARQRWGDAVCDTRGQLDRALIAARVFGDTAEARDNLKFLESWTHPRIGERLRQQAVEAAQSGAPLLVLDAPLMLKGGWADLCDAILFVDAPRAARLARAQARGWTVEQFDAREAAQETLDEKRTHATYVIDNGGTREQAEAQIEALWPKLTL